MAWRRRAGGSRPRRSKPFVTQMYHVHSTHKTSSRSGYARRWYQAHSQHVKCIYRRRNLYKRRARCTRTGTTRTTSNTDGPIMGRSRGTNQERKTKSTLCWPRPERKCREAYEEVIHRGARHGHVGNRVTPGRASNPRASPVRRPHVTLTRIRLPCASCLHCRQARCAIAHGWWPDTYTLHTQ